MGRPLGPLPWTLTASQGAEHSPVFKNIKIAEHFKEIDNELGEQQTFHLLCSFFYAEQFLFACFIFILLLVIFAWL